MNAPHPTSAAPAVAIGIDAARTLASLTSRGVIAADREGRVTWVNEGFTRIAGYTLDDVAGRRPGDFLHGKDTDPETVRHMRAALGRGRSFDVEVLNYRKGGGPFWSRVEVHPVRDAAGTITGFVSLHADVTRRREALRRLERSESEARELAFIADRIPGPVSIESADGTLIWVNRGWTRCYGYPPSEALGRRAADLLDGRSTDPSVRAAMQAAVLRGENVRGQITKHTRDGAPLRMAVERQPVTDALGRVIRVICIASEITPSPAPVDPAAHDAYDGHDDDAVWAAALDAAASSTPSQPA